MQPSTTYQALTTDRDLQSLSNITQACKYILLNYVKNRTEVS